MKKKGCNTFSILSIIFAFVFFPLGIIFGIIALIQIKKTGEKGTALAIAGIIYVFVAIPLVWIFLRNDFWNSGVPINETDYGDGVVHGHDAVGNCYDIHIDPIHINCSNIGSSKICDVTLQRSGIKDHSIAGVKLLFKDTIAGTNSVVSIPGNILPSQTKIQTGINAGFSTANIIEVSPYFKDEWGNDMICAETGIYQFA